MAALGGLRDLKVYRLAFSLAMEIFYESKKFPAEEKYSLTDQIRRASRSVPSNIAEGYRKKRYPRMLQDGGCRWGRLQKPKCGWILHLSVAIFRRRGNWS